MKRLTGLLLVLALGVVVLSGYWGAPRAQAQDINKKATFGEVKLKAGCVWPVERYSSRKSRRLVVRPSTPATCSDA